jgi:hypothetical protein
MNRLTGPIANNAAFRKTDALSETDVWSLLAADADGANAERLIEHLRAGAQDGSRSSDQAWRSAMNLAADVLARLTRSSST